MTTFAPAKVFLRVDDKFYPEFIDADQELKFGPSFLYLHLFRFCRYTDRCWPSQETLAKRCKCSVRSVQSYLQELVRLEYIEVLFQDGHNVYVLLLSSRVRHFLMLTGTTLVEEKKTSSTVVALAKEAHSGGENFSYYKRVLRNKESPLPPISPLLNPSLSTAPVCSSSSCRCQGDAPLRSEVGRGDSFSAQSETHPPATPSVRATRSVRTRRADEIQTQNADFDRLWAIWPTTAVWPMPRNRNLARTIFLSLARAGQLPPIEAHLATVVRFKAQDSRWKNGYPPELSSWLRGRGFEKEPLIRSARDSATRSDTHEAVGTALTAEQQHRLLELQKTCAEPLFSRDSASPLSADVKALCALWGTQTEPIAVFLAYLAQSGHKLHTSGLLTEAQAYLAEISTPAPLLVWLRDYTMRTAQ